MEQINWFIDLLIEWIGNTIQGSKKKRKKCYIHIWPENYKMPNRDERRAAILSMASAAAERLRFKKTDMVVFVNQYIALMCTLNHGLEWAKWVLTNLSHSRPWFNTLSPRSHESRMTAHPWIYDTDGCTRVDLWHAWLQSGYTTLDSMLEMGTCDSWSVGLFDVSCSMNSCSDFLHTFCV